MTLSLLLIACSNKPGEDEILNAVIESKSQPELIKVVSANKINGWMDGEFYVAEVEYVLEFQLGISEVTSQLKEEVRTNLFDSLVTGFSSLALKMEYGDFERGDQFTKKETFQFRETEQGWMLKP